MFGFFSRFLPPEQDLRTRLSLTRKVRVSGVLFTIKKIDVLDYLEGARVLHEIFSTYKTKNEKVLDDKMVGSIKKAREYMRDVIMAGVVKPAVVRKPEENLEAIPVDELMNDWTLAQDLVGEILRFTYGKKK